MKSITIKNPQQIVGIRKSCQLAASCLTFIEPYVVPGVTTEKLDSLIEEYIADHGATPAPLNYKVGKHYYPKATCISVNEVICHGIPDKYELKEGDILNIDVTTILNGYFGDTSRMYFVGDISEEAQHVVNVAKESLDIGIKQVKHGAYFMDIGYHITKFAKSQGCGVVYHFCGHGVGLAFHEEPQICHNVTRRGQAGDLKMKHGMIFTIEPMINLGDAQAVICESDNWTARTVDGKLSAQYEHTVLVTRKGCDILTKGE